MLGGVAVAGGGVVSWPVASKIVSTESETRSINLARHGSRSLG